MDIKHIAELACLSLSDDEAELLAKDMELIESMIGQLPELESTDTEREPMELREDEIVQNFTREELLSSAPNTREGFVVIPETVV
ncbi:MAG: Asp-tRNA(Asn)/Glu-tRNA(Gln) amidotransferase subunit GatC [Ruminococcus sp.]|nr:Asp-tRNA(Asn)/Glu-tRNA(Gln) amidotransferase subunit GatC [Ruminococcus sp.]